ncbi:hypothetical protein Tco_0307412 [Tanacetum coccineum]
MPVARAMWGCGKGGVMVFAGCELWFLYSRMGDRDSEHCDPALHSGIQDQPVLTTHSDLWQDVKKRVMTKQFHKLAVTKNTMAQDLNSML